MSVLAIGTVAFDSIETPFGSVGRILGGSATYITLAARYLSEPVRLVGVVGGDFPQEYTDKLRQSGVDTEGLVLDREGKTFAWGGRYHYDLNDRDTLFTDLNVLQGFDPIVPESFRDSRIVCLGNLEPTIQRRVLEQLTGPELVMCDTMNYWIENTPDSLRETLKVIDCLIINDSEARELAEEPNLIRAARAIRAMGPDMLVIKKGEHGAMLFINDVIFVVPAYPLEDIQDPTGAGDAFMGGIAGYLAGQPHIDEDCLKRAVVYGSAMASFVVEKFGPERLFDLTEDEIQGRLRGFHALSALPTLIPSVSVSS